MPKFGDLTALTGPNVAAGDLFVIDDVSATASKSVRGDALLQGALAASGKAVLDENSNEWLTFVTTVAAVNQVTITNSATGNPVLLAATGGDTNIGVKANAKGSGTITLNDVGTGNVLVGTNVQIASAKSIVDAGGNELITWPATVASAINNLKVSNSAAGAAVLLAAIGDDTDIGVKVDGKGAGAVSLNLTGTGNVIIGTNLQMGSAKSIVDANGNEIIKSAATVASAVNEVTVTNAATGNAVQIGTTGGDTDINLKLVPKGAGVVQVDGGVLSIDPSDGVGYATGAGGAVTQITGRTTGVTINKVCGSITLFSAAGSATPFTFTVTNSTVAATDVVNVCQKSGTDAYRADVTNVSAGSFKVTVTDLTGTTTEAPVFNFAVNKSVAS